MINKKKKYKLADFDYPLPEKYIAQYPAARRDRSKLMVVDRETGKIEHKIFSNMVEYFRKNDLIIMNNTKVFPARLYASKDKTDAKVEVFLLRELENELWEVMVRPARKVRIGNKLMFGKNVFCDVIDNTISGGRVVRFEYAGDNFYEIIDRIGTSPLPPYIKRMANGLTDKWHYLNVNGAPTRDVLSWDYLVEWEATKTYNQLCKNTPKSLSEFAKKWESYVVSRNYTGTKHKLIINY